MHITKKRIHHTFYYFLKLILSPLDGIRILYYQNSVIILTSIAVILCLLIELQLVYILRNNRKRSFYQDCNVCKEFTCKTERFFNWTKMTMKSNGQTFRTRDVIQISRGSVLNADLQNSAGTDSMDTMVRMSSLQPMSTPASSILDSAGSRGNSTIALPMVQFFFNIFFFKCQNFILENLNKKMSTFFFI